MLVNDLHRKGFKVIGTSREPEKYVCKFSFQFVKLDINDDNSINDFAEQIIVFKIGEIVEQGNHQSLVNKKAYYYNLVKNQLELRN